MKHSWSLADTPQLAGMRFLITGANSGIGYYAAVEIARHGGAIVMACRDMARGQAALARLRREAVGPRSAADEARLVPLDLASLDSVRRLADAELAANQPLHCLINNAGVMGPNPRQLTQEGFEMQFGVNVLGHFALTCQLMPLLEHARASKPQDAPRIVTVASIAHKRARLHFDDLQGERTYNPMAWYQQSKLADLMFAFELERRLRRGRLAAISVAVHPGVAPTPLFQNPLAGSVERWFRSTAIKAAGFFFNSEREGALPTLYAATAEGVQGGAYYGPQGLGEMRGGDVGPAKIFPQAQDLTAAARLWNICEELTGIRCPELQ